MKQFKNIFIFGVVVLLLVCVAIIQYATPSRMVDFRGEILSIAVSEDGIVTLSAASDIEGPFLFRIDDKSIVIASKHTTIDIYIPIPQWRTNGFNFILDTLFYRR